MSKAKTVWKNCVRCNKAFFYDARVKKCAKCCREERENSDHVERRND